MKTKTLLRIIELRNRGLKQKDIAKKVGVSQATVSYTTNAWGELQSCGGDFRRFNRQLCTTTKNYAKQLHAETLTPEITEFMAEVQEIVDKSRKPVEKRNFWDGVKEWIKGL